jgi:hypothetical protein
MNDNARNPIDFVVGDLVYYTGNANPYGFPYTYSSDKEGAKRVGIVVKVNTTAFHTYSVYWLKDELASNHVANHLELVYNV